MSFNDLHDNCPTCAQRRDASRVRDKSEKEIARLRAVLQSCYVFVMATGKSPSLEKRIEQAMEPPSAESQNTGDGK